MQITNSSKAFLWMIVILGWFALISQCYLIIENRVAPVPETIIRYFSFFTILTNLLVAICCTTLLSKSDNFLKNFFSKQTTLTAIAVYITIVGSVYNIILRFLWKPEGLQWVVDEILHSIIPVLFILVWLFFIPRGKIAGKSVLAWLLYPLIYLILILSRGHYSSFYPYPFIDVSKIGFNKTLVNSAGMLLAFLVVSILFIALNRLKKPAL
ncbi:MAG TPA: Pr6Pr family membrane protein [Ginsengibacter sp.]|nr:Pr6Pr family membrane protein [Ginsengibacter sp.]